MSTRITAALVSLMMCAVMLSGCLQADDENKIISEELDSNNGVFVTGENGQSIDVPPLPLNFVFSNVGEDGPEPSIGITSSGCIFFIAMEKPMRSCDHGVTWENSRDFTQAPFTSDPYGWVDPVTDRVFNIHMMGLESTWIGWSDDDGESWLGNPHDSGTTPLNDHIKLATGPWVSDGYGIPGSLSPIYEEAVYFVTIKDWGFSVSLVLMAGLLSN